MPWTFPHGGRLEQSPEQPRGHSSPWHVGEGWGNGQESSDLGYIYSAVSILCSHRESHRASSPAAPRAAWEIKAALMGGEAASAPLKGNAGAAPAPHSSFFSTVLPPGFIPPSITDPQFRRDKTTGTFLLKGLRNIPRKRRNQMAKPPWEAVGGSWQSQGSGDAVQSHPWAEPGTSLGHQPGNRWV